MKYRIQEAALKSFMTESDMWIERYRPAYNEPWMGYNLLHIDVDMKVYIEKNLIAKAELYESRGA